MKHLTKPFEPGGGTKVYNAIFEREVYSMLIDSYLLVCETKAFKLDLAILLVHREPEKKLLIKTNRPLINLKPEDRF